MSTPFDPTGPGGPPGDGPVAERAPDDSRRPDRRRDLLWVLVVFVVLGLVGGLVWQWVASAPTVERTTQGAVMDQAQLGVKISADGWFAVVGLVGGMIGGFGLLRPRRDPLLVVVVGLAASVGAAFLALWLGSALTDVPRSEIRAAKVGAEVTTSLTLISRAVVLAWPLGFLVATTASLWGNEKAPRTEARTDEPDGARTGA